MPDLPEPLNAVDLRELAALLRKVAGQVEQLLDGMPRSEARRRATPELKPLGELLPAMRAALGDSKFTTRDLLEHTAHAPELSKALRVAFGKRLNARTLGSLFSRGAGVQFGSYVLEREAGTVREGTLWRVCDSHAIRTPSGS